MAAPAPSSEPAGPDPARELELIDAAAKGDAARCARLVREGADPCANAQPELVGSALAAAASVGHAEALRAMLEAAEERSAPLALDEPVGSLHASPLRWALASSTLNAEVVRLLLARGASWRAPPHTVTALSQAACNDSTEVLRWVLAATPREQLDDVDSTGRTALHYATSAGRIEHMRALLAAGASPEAGRVHGALHCAVELPSLEAVRVLVEAGADANAARSDTGDTVLLAASGTDDVELLAYLVAHGADPDRRARDGQSARDSIMARDLIVPGV